jgi:hypothetical protein
MTAENAARTDSELSAPISGYTPKGGIAISGCAKDVPEVTHDRDAQSTLHIAPNSGKDVADILRTKTGFAEITHNLLSDGLAATGGSLNQTRDDPGRGASLRAHTGSQRTSAWDSLEDFFSQKGSLTVGGV